MSYSNQVMGGFATVGRTRAQLSFYCFLCVGVVLLVVGGVHLAIKDKSVPVTARAKDAKCDMSIRQGNSTHDCQVVAEYVYGGKTYTDSLELKDRDKAIKKGSSLTVRINPDKPGQAMSRRSFKTMAVVASVLAVVCILCAVIQRFIARSPTMSTAYGAKTLFNVM